VLAAHFLDECKGDLDIGNATFAPSLLKHLVAREYPGNIRELRNLIREVARRAAFELDTVLTVEHLPEHFAGVVAAEPTNVVDMSALLPQAAASAAASASASAPQSQSGAPVVVGTPLAPGEKPGSKPPAAANAPGTDDNAGGFWNEVEMQELVS